MITFYFICGTLTIFSILLILSSINKDMEPVFIGGILILTITVVVGWLAIGFLFPVQHKTEYLEIPAYITGNKAVTFVDDRTFTFRSYEEIELIKSGNYKVKIVRSYSPYHIEVQEQIRIVENK